jgi:hypothetical protein
MAKERRLVSLACLALALGLSTASTGCHMAPRIEMVSSDGAPAPNLDPFDWPRPIRVGITPEWGRYGGLHHLVAHALEDGVDRLVMDYRPSRESERVDYVIDLDIGVDGDGRLTNFLAVFPGFVLFMPSWYQLRWDYVVTTHVRVRRAGGGGDGEGSGAREAMLHDAFVVKHTPPGIAVGAYLGWGALLFPPMLISPLVTGAVAALDDWEPRRFVDVLHDDPETGRRWALGVASTARRLIDEDLRVE